MADPAGLHQALQRVVALRDKAVVLRISPGALSSAERLLKFAASLSVLRALGVRLFVVFDTADTGLGSPYAMAPALRLIGAISQNGQRAISLPATGVITIYRPPLAVAPGSPAPAEAAAAMPPAARDVVMVDPVLLTHLGSLGYITILLLPVVDAEGSVLDVAADEIAAAVGMFLDAALLVFVRAPDSQAAPLPATAAGRQTVVTSPMELDQILSDMLFAGVPDCPAPVSKSRSRRAR